MTKQQYITTRNTNQINISQFYKFYTDNGGTYPFNVFASLFGMYLQSNISNIFQLMDTYFNVTVVTKGDQFIKVY